MKALIYCAPGEGYGLYIFPNGAGWQDSEMIMLDPVWPDAWYAWEFCISHLMIDCAPKTVSGSQWTYRPPPPKEPEQRRLL